MVLMRFEIRVVANSPHPGVEEKDGLLRVRVRAKPLEGEANREIVKVLADYFGVMESGVRIISGAKSKRKIIEVDSK